MIYGKRRNGKLHGTVFTKTEVVDTILNLVGYLPSKNLSKITLIDPAGGEGVFIIAAVERLYTSSLKHGFNFLKAVIEKVKVYEIDSRKCDVILRRLQLFLKSKGLKLGAKELKKVVICYDFLVSDNISADIIVGNPPYVRHEKIPKKKKSQYRKLFKTFTYRSDIYVCFYEKSLSALKKGGSLCFICSNRWLKNQYGKYLRKLIQENYSFPLIINLEKVNAFEEEVIAYPAITLIQNSELKSFAETKYFEAESMEEIIDFDITKTTARSENILIVEGGSESQYFKEFESKNLSTIEGQKFKIGIGVATGADSVFIVNKFEDLIEPEILLPIIQSKDLKSGSLKWSGHFVINPYSSSSTDLVNLIKYPLLRKYLFKHKVRLSNRHTAKKNTVKWYKTIDRIYPDLLKKPKLLLPDFGTNQRVYLDSGKYYPHHNLYYITGNNSSELRILGAILMSSFVKKQLEIVGNKMNGGYVRWQSQNLRKLRIPEIASMSTEYRNELEKNFITGNSQAIDKLIGAFLNAKKPKRISNQENTMAQSY